MTICLRHFTYKLNMSVTLIVTLRSLRSSHTLNTSPTHRSAFLFEFINGRCNSSLTTQASRSTALVLTNASYSPVQYFQNDELTRKINLDQVISNDIFIEGGSSSAISELSKDLETKLLAMKSMHPAVTSHIVAFHRSCSPLTELEKSMILASDGSPSKMPMSTNAQGKPTEDQLNQVFDVLSKTLPNFFSMPQNYRIFHKNLIFQNNLTGRGTTTIGISNYVVQMSIIRLIGHLRFAFVNMDVLKITKHPEDGTIRIRWRIQGVPGNRVFLQFWKFPIFNNKRIIGEEYDWYDGFSTFYLGSDGLIHKHVCDKMMPDHEREVTSSKTNIAAKLALLLGAIPKPTVQDLADISQVLVKLQDYPTNDNLSYISSQKPFPIRQA